MGPLYEESKAELIQSFERLGWTKYSFGEHSQTWFDYWAYRQFDAHFCSSKVAALALFCYDYALTLEREIRFIWIDRPSFIKYIFLLNRYFALVAAIVNVAASMSMTIGNELYVVLFPISDLLRFTFLIAVSLQSLPLLQGADILQGGSWGGFFIAATGSVQVSLAELILILRLYAIYESNRMILYCLVPLLSVTSGVSLVVLWFAQAKRTEMATYPVRFCHTITNRNFLYAFWLPILVFECTAFGFAAYKTHEHMRELNRFRPAGIRNTLSAARIFEILFRDSLLYFASALILFLANGLMWRYAALQDLTLIDGPTSVLIAILTSRMILNVHQSQDKHMEAYSLNATVTTDMEFATVPERRDHDHVDGLGHDETYVDDNEPRIVDPESELQRIPGERIDIDPPSEENDFGALILSKSLPEDEALRIGESSFGSSRSRPSSSRRMLSRDDP
ncbi:hypothetical protein SISSUDRAFT_1057807 [Sistotremastrum suecicum HHB10207 ss-3]|uniref:DUF6533 domain-containing protein n=1 Tax=Sistotremastrum suecicum HHB10207 ss-3 TaxID=1314776 RepID=A0A166I5H4_9AGAM|nr:hypothetical protein SISSUDRAFT_1057807 [Sistotremastrum suecicum HHB10207 ss-3]